MNLPRPRRHDASDEHPAEPGLRVRGVARTFGAKSALKDLNLDVRPGQVVSLLGPNGSGKSTSMKVLSGVVAPSAGTVELELPGIRASLADPVGFKRHVGLVPDVGGLFPRLTGWEHLELSARLRNLRNWEERAHELLGTSDLTNSAGERSSTYSHGMSRKLSVLMAVLSEPEVLLLDEPFDGVDPLGIETIEELVTSARDRGACVLVSTHLLDVAARLSDRVLVIRRGETVTDSSITEMTSSTPAGTLDGAYKALLR